LINLAEFQCYGFLGVDSTVVLDLAKGIGSLISKIRIFAQEIRIKTLAVCCTHITVVQYRNRDIPI